MHGKGGGGVIGAVLCKLATYRNDSSILQCFFDARYQCHKWLEQLQPNSLRQEPRSTPHAGRAACWHEGTRNGRLRIFWGGVDAHDDIVAAYLVAMRGSIRVVVGFPLPELFGDGGRTCRWF